MPVPELSCGAKFAKMVLFAFNFVIWIVGAAMLGVGIWVKVDPNAIKLFRIATISQGHALADAATIVVIAIGAIIFLIGFLGCCGAIRESVCMLTTYAIILLVILCLQIAAGVMAAVYRKNIIAGLSQSMHESVQNKYQTYGQNPKDLLSRALDYMQVKLECCGTKSYRDWRTSKWYNETQIPSNNKTYVPLTCCVLTKPDPDQPNPVSFQGCVSAARDLNTDSSEYLHTEGCHDKLLSFVHRFGGIIIGVAFGFVAIQILGVVIACCLRNAIRKKDYPSYG